MSTLTRAGILGLMISVGCASDPRDPAGTQGARIPRILGELVLARDSDEITPVIFPHARHQDLELGGRRLGCVGCHHTLSDRPESPPAACGTCHPHDAEEGQPPDI